MKIREYKALTVDEQTIEVVKNFIEDERKGDVKARKKAKLDLQECLVKTSDGSYTFNSESFSGKSETMHTHHGAITESMEKFVKPARLEGKNEVFVLDICSGLGYNAATCIEFLNGDVKIELDMLEISRETLALTLLLDTPLKSYKIIKKAMEDELYKEGIIKFRHYEKEITERININLHIEDARRTVEKLEGQKTYDAVFLDPFSPLKSPELYTSEFFRCLKSLLKDDGVILTYTSAAPVRSAIVQNGLHVGEGPSYGRSGGTVAALNLGMLDKPLSMNDERMIALSDAGIPFKDPEFNASSQQILQRREQERKIARGREKFSSTVKTPKYLNQELEEGRLKRRVLNNLKKLGFDDLTSPKSLFLVCPQYSRCICGRGCENYDNSRERINEMSHRV
ncbi:MAG TPA: MnmC family methyltransferase, partial [Methanobacterium sp.]